MTSFNISAITNSDGQQLDKYDINKKLEDLGIPDEIIDKGPDEVEKYAEENGIDLSSLQPPQDEQKSHKDVHGANGKIKQEFEAKLEELGIPKETIEQGKEAVEEYAAQNNITLPSPPRSGSKLNLQS